MEETQNTVESGESKVGFPGAPTKKRSFKPILFVIVALLLVAGIFAYLIFRGDVSNTTIEVTPSPTAFVTSSPTPEPTVTEVDKADLKVQVLNGTGIPGEASYLQKKLSDDGFSNIEVDNADNTNYKTTEVKFSQNVGESVKDELMALLEANYNEVEVSSAVSGSFDIVIITGLRKGASPTVTRRPTATGAATPTPTRTGTPTVTGTGTVTPTKTPTPTTP